MLQTVYVITKEKRENVIYLMDISIPSDQNVIMKHLEKKQKHQDLAMEIRRIWKQIAPYITTTGMTPQLFSKLIKNKLEQKMHILAPKATILPHL